MSLAASQPKGPFAPFERMLALRYLRSRRGRFVSVTALFSFIGITLGVAALIIALSVTNGFRKELFDRIMGLNGHIIVHPIGSSFENYTELSTQAENVPGVLKAMPVIEGQALASSANTKRPNGILARGMTEKDLRHLTAVASNLRFGTLDDFDQSKGVIIGMRLANNLNVFVGGEITLLGYDGEVTPFGSTPRRMRFPVVGLFETGVNQYDGNFVFMPLKEAQTFFKLGQSVHVLEVLTDSPDNMDVTEPLLKEAVGNEMFLTDWRQTNAELYNTLKVERAITFIVIALIVFVAVLNIVSGLTTLVKEKGRNIAILRTMGASRGAIMRVFFVAGTSIGVIGTLVGVVLGLLVSTHIDGIKTFIEHLINVNLFNPKVYSMPNIPHRTDPVEVIEVACMALSFSMLATLYPALKAAKLDPVEALRYE